MGAWTIREVMEYSPTSGGCALKTSYARIAIHPSSPTGTQPLLNAWIVESQTGSVANKASAATNPAGLRRSAAALDSSADELGTGQARGFKDWGRTFTAGNARAIVRSIVVR